MLHCSRYDCREYPQWSLRVSRIIFYDKRCQIIYIIGIKENTEKLTLDEVVDLLPPPAGRGVQLEGPQEVGRVLEVGANRENLDKKPLGRNQSVSQGVEFSVSVSEKIKPLILLSKGCIKSLSSGKECIIGSYWKINHLMDEILHADDAKLAKSSLHQVVGGDSSAVAIDLRHYILDLKI